MRLRKSILPLFLLCCVAVTFFNGSAVRVYAYSEELDDLMANSLSQDFSTNHNRVVSLGGFIIYAVEKYLIFYDPDDGELVKSLEMPHGGASEGHPASAVGVYNETAVIWFYSGTYFASPYAYNEQRCWLVDVASLDYSVEYYEFEADGGGSDYMAGCDIIHTDNNVWFGVAGGANSAAYVIQLTNTSALVEKESGEFFSDGTIAIPSYDDPTIFYTISGGNGDGIALVSEVDVTGGTVTSVGTTGAADTWGNFTYFFGWSYDTDGTSAWYDVGVAFASNIYSERIVLEVLRFNDTYVGYDHLDEATDSAVAVTYPYCVWRNGIWADTEELIEGYYLIVYVSTTYNLKEFTFNVTGLETLSSFGVGDTGYHYAYQNKVHAYTSDDIGGFQSPEYTVGIYIDFDNGLVCADTFMAYNPAAAYVYGLNPSPTYLLGDDFQLYIDGAYAYYGETFFSQVQTGDGTYIVTWTGFSANPHVIDEGSYSTWTSGAIDDGYFEFVMPRYLGSLDWLHAGFNVTCIIGGSTACSTLHNVTFAEEGIDDNFDNIPDEDVDDTPDFQQGDNGLGSLMYIILIFAVVMLPSLICAEVGAMGGFGVQGFFCGMAIGTGAGVAAGLLEFYFLLLIALAMSILVFSLIKRV